MWPLREHHSVMALMIVTYLTLFVACSSPFDTSASKCWTTRQLAPAKKRGERHLCTGQRTLAPRLLTNWTQRVY
uniref:Putative secreted protein n=1 Tax=Ixodes ricinus TaxID=34613 RepID=A0A6B0TYR3_IXORI